MTQPTFFPRFDRAELADHSRGRDAPESQGAYERVRPSIGDEQARILAWLRDRGDKGGTAREYALHAGKPLHAVSGRFSELAHDGLIRKAALPRREDCGVWCAVECGGDRPESAGRPA